MKKTRYIAMALVIAVMLMGAGYAYWTDSIEIGNTVTTGTFGLKFAFIKGDTANDFDNYPGMEDYVGNTPGTYQNPGNWELRTGNSQVTLSNNKKSLNFQFTNFYPGAGAHVKFRIINDGTVPAILHSLNITNIVDDADIDGKLEYLIQRVQLKNTVGNGVVETLYPAPGANGIKAYSLAEFEARLNEILSRVTIGKDQYIEVNGTNGYEIVYPLGTVEDNTTEDVSLSFDVVMNWKQWNAK